MSERVKCAEDMFNKGYVCSQAVFAAFSDMFGLDKEMALRIGNGFGGGIATRTYLNGHPEVNVIIWAWCGQMSTATEADINTYLNLMSALEKDFPNVKFVYMTGHTDGTGLTGTLHLRNNMIREYCQRTNKILFDYTFKK
ncbi:MAG TPA: C-GCAxxG-C-C family protein [Pseudobacteroides sp.]|nr:C-GCAxxG-C-C family protein [Pseudobacteroides sp.]